MSQVHIEIGTLIREHRIKKGLTQTQLASMLGHETSQFVSFIERGISKTPLNTLGQLIIILGIPEKRVMDSLIQAHKENLVKEISIGKKSAKKIS